MMRCTSKSLSFKNPRGFIVLEGVNGAGKSTLQSGLAEHLRKTGQKVLCTREPGGTTLGKELRGILQEGRVGRINERAELLLFAADRAEHVEQVIKPSLEKGELVICDRYFYSTTAFQGYGRGINTDLIQRINEAAIGGVLPDVVLLLDLDPAAGLARNKIPGSSKADTFEQESLEFHKRIREGFLAIADASPSPFVVIDASKDPQEVLKEGLAIVERILASRIA